MVSPIVSPSFLTVSSSGLVTGAVAPLVAWSRVPVTPVTRSLTAAPLVIVGSRCPSGVMVLVSGSPGFPEVPGNA